MASIAMKQFFFEHDVDAFPTRQQEEDSRVLSLAGEPPARDSGRKRSD